MFRVLGAAIALSLGLSGISSATEWVSVSTANQAINYVDIQSIRRSGSIAWYWTYTIYAEPDRDGVLSFASYESTDCDRRVVRLRKYIEYDSSRRTTFKTEPDDRGPLVKIDAGTPAEAIFRFVCLR